MAAFIAGQQKNHIAKPSGDQALVDYPVGDFAPDALSSVERDILHAVIEALYSLRSQGAYAKAKELEAKYFPDGGVERTMGDQATASRSLVSGGNA